MVVTVHSQIVARLFPKHFVLFNHQRGKTGVLVFSRSFRLRHFATATRSDRLLYSPANVKLAADHEHNGTQSPLAQAPQRFVSEQVTPPSRGHEHVKHTYPQPSEWFAGHQMPAQIKTLSQSVAQKMQSADTMETVLWYFDYLEQICQSSGQRFSYQHISAIFNGTAKVWMSAQHKGKSWSQQQKLDQALQGFLRKMLGQLLLLLPEMDCRGASNILWAFSRMQVNPEHLVPGTVDGLAQRFVEDIHSANGHSYASFMLACGHLKLNPLRGEMFPILMDQLRKRDLRDLNSQAAANIMYSLAKASVAPPAMHLLHKLHNRFLVHLLSNRPDVQPSAQEIANFAWAMSELRYLPSSQIASAMKARMLDLCQRKQHQPKSTEISSFVHACAQLRIAITQQETDILVDCFCIHRRVQARGVANIAWALAVSRLLTLERFRQLLSYMSAMKEQASRKRHLTQMYQAWDRLHASVGKQVEQTAAWAEAQAQLHSLGPRPLSRKNLRNGGLYAALAELELQFQPDCQICSYRVNAVVIPSVSTARPIIILVGEPDCFINEPSRLMGRAVFCQELLEKQGDIVSVPLTVAENSSRPLTGFLRPALQVAAGGSLDAYRLQQPHPAAHDVTGNQQLFRA